VIGGEMVDEKKAKKETSEARKKSSRENGKKGGKEFKYTPQELEQKIDTYFTEHNTDDNTPDWPDMLRYIGLSDSMVDKYLKDERYTTLGYSEPVKKAIGLFTTFWTKYGLAHPNLQTFCIFMLKQVKYGGYTDKQQLDTNNKHQVEIDIKGI
jgi:hypothetical protein